MVSNVAPSKNPMDSLCCLRIVFGITFNTTEPDHFQQKNCRRRKNPAPSKQDTHRQPVSQTLFWRLNAILPKLSRISAPWARRLKSDDHANSFWQFLEVFYMSPNLITLIRVFLALVSIALFRAGSYASVAAL